CEYLSPAHCEEILDVEILVGRIGSTSVTYDFRFSHDGRDVARGRMTSVCCRVAPGEAPASHPLPAEVSQKLRTYLQPTEPHA
ncbi:MAG TPA: hotdog domain-containing protein, partial [Lacipirellulaceae bacterium]|nr:hotdog domain-containing protein [Lacipirellulaceae bacterium]